ncbi:AfsA-related hotdog domain-containing protein [Nocardia amamiensis]|uniref:AfsA-related hotdog domain-containing protein n=1 Tax=Nocardia amamiensis TaxID=404578 RepID=UPI0008357571|nr:AfsA-related hotdog domain-containing protein [Nocardia amamiensis]
MSRFRPELLAVGECPADIVIDVEVDRNLKTRGQLTNATMTYAVIADGEVAANCESSFICMPREPYDELRTEGIAKKSRLGVEPRRNDELDLVTPEEVGRSNRKNVVIGRGNAGTYPICLATDHPSLFDHEVDHVSGAVILEAWRQTALMHLSSPASGFDMRPEDLPRIEITSFAASFSDFTELDCTPYCRVLRSSIGPADTGGRSIEMSMAILQRGVQVAEIELGLHLI